MESINPYESPKSKTYESSLKTYQPKLLTTNGRIGRLRYLCYSTVATIIFAVAVALLVGVVAPGLSELTLGIVMVVTYIPLLIYSIFVMKRRLNDLDRTGWLQLLIFIPLVGALFALYLVFWPGTKGQNTYGPPPTKNSALIILGGSILPLVFVAGILAAIAIPAYQDYATRAQQAISN